MRYIYIICGFKDMILNISKKIIFILILTISPAIFAQESPSKLTLTTNIISLFGLGDFNIRGEYRLNQDQSILLSGHYNPDEKRAKKTKNP